MKSKSLVIIPGIAIIFLILGFFIGMEYSERYKTDKPEPAPTEQPTTEEEPETGIVKDVTTKIVLGQEQTINCLEKMNIEGTNDYFAITKAVKWEVPEHEPGETVSFVILIPYTITIDGKEYLGSYQLGDNSQSVDDNPKYNVVVTNLTKDGIVTINITNK